MLGRRANDLKNNGLQAENWMADIIKKLLLYHQRVVRFHTETSLFDWEGFQCVRECIQNGGVVQGSLKPAMFEKKRKKNLIEQLGLKKKSYSGTDKDRL